MKILVIGASGRVGNILTKKLLNEGHIVIGSSRQDKKKLFDSASYTQINLDLLASIEAIEGKFPDDLDAVYFVSGSRGKNLLQLDLDGAIKAMKVTEKKKASRFIMLSSIFSLEPGRWEKEGLSSLRNYYVAKHYADLWLINNTDLNYTILQPGALVETEGSGKIQVNVDRHGENSIENVAEVLLEILNQPTTVNKIISMHDGNTPIKQALIVL
ncbi:NAD(P)H-binding protein [Algoriphagus sp.]|uniref:NAD(P)H-binding protein n=1 Tax=Algoriphagus sp. TaxID=1872435 RepID=UPI003F70BBFD